MRSLYFIAYPIFLLQLTVSGFCDSSSNLKFNHPQPLNLHALACQLLGMNCATPTDFSFSFKGFSLRGGNTDNHCHGWGLCLYEGNGLRSFHDPLPCSSSPIADLVATLPMRTLNMLSHIRYATQGSVCLENVHPFAREMWGIQWSFAHNGDVPLFNCARGDLPWIGQKPGQRIYNPVGDTDSERMFCSILNALKANFDTLPDLLALHEYLDDLFKEITSHDEERTILNCLLGCGQYMQFAYSWPGQRPGSNVWNGLHYVVREPPFKRATLIDCDYEVDFSELAGDGDRVAVIATKPLTGNEGWMEFDKGQLILFSGGNPILNSKGSLDSQLSVRDVSSDNISSNPYLKTNMGPYQHDKNFYSSGLGI